MSAQGQDENVFRGLKSFKRKAVNLSHDALVRTGYLKGSETFPLVIEPEVENLNAVEWARSARQLIETRLLEHGAILFRNFKTETADRFEEFARAIVPDLLDYRERAAPRKEVGKNIYTSTEYPSDVQIPLHHEMSYAHNWPMKLFFFCLQPAALGGATPIASDRLFLKRLNPAIQEIFLRKKVMYVRNYGEGLDLSWQEAFQTKERVVVENYCREAGTEFEWREGDRLRTRHVGQVMASHPKTGETVWFNHAHMFHQSNLDESFLASLLMEFDEESLPRNAFYGDGSPIEASVLEEVRETYAQTAVTFDWQQGDVLLVDNMLASHGRSSFIGPRKILVAMAEPFKP
jgi:alpha-ketoglutarate-dependent taurine dioxygenase